MSTEIIDRPAFVAGAINAKLAAEEEARNARQEQMRVILGNCNRIAQDACKARSAELLPFFEPKLLWDAWYDNYGHFNARRFLQPIPGIGRVTVHVSGRSDALGVADPFRPKPREASVKVLLEFYGARVDTSDVSKLRNSYRADVVVDLFDTKEENWTTFWFKAAQDFEEAAERERKSELQKRTNDATSIRQAFHYNPGKFAGIEEAQSALDKAIDLDPANEESSRHSFAEWKRGYDAWQSSIHAWDAYAAEFIASWQDWAVTYAKYRMTTIANLAAWGERQGHDVVTDYRLTYAKVASDDGETYLETDTVLVLDDQPDTAGYYRVVRYGEIYRTTYKHVVLIENRGIKSWRMDLRSYCRTFHVGNDYSVKVPPTVEMSHETFKAITADLVLTLPEEPSKPEALSRFQCAVCVREALRNIIALDDDTKKFWLKYVPTHNQYLGTSADAYVVETDRPMTVNNEEGDE